MKFATLIIRKEENTMVLTSEEGNDEAMTFGIYLFDPFQQH